MRSGSRDRLDRDGYLSVEVHAAQVVQALRLVTGTAYPHSPPAFLWGIRGMAGAAGGVGGGAGITPGGAAANRGGEPTGAGGPEGGDGWTVGGGGASPGALPRRRPRLRFGSPITLVS